MDFFCKCDQIRRKLQIWSHLRKKSLMENLFFCAVKQSKKSSKTEQDQETLVFAFVLSRSLLPTFYL